MVTGPDVKLFSNRLSIHHISLTCVSLPDVSTPAIGLEYCAMACSGDRCLGFVTKVHALLGVLKPRGFEVDRPPTCTLAQRGLEKENWPGLENPNLSRWFVDERFATGAHRWLILQVARLRLVGFPRL